MNATATFALAISADHPPAALVACVERELRLREKAYPRWVELGRMSIRKSHEEMAAMRAVLDVLRQIAAQAAPAPAQAEMFGGGR